MTEFYLDIETVKKDPDDPNEKSNLDPNTGKIATIQFQQLSSSTGRSIGPLTILKEWESSEKDIVNDFRKKFLTPHPFGFIPIGFNLPFEFRFLSHKFGEFGQPVDPFAIFHDKPHLDLKPIFVILNNGNFTGCGLDKFTQKKDEGHLVEPRYRAKEYAEIEQYITQEANEFIRAYQTIKKTIPQILTPNMIS